MVPFGSSVAILVGSTRRKVGAGNLRAVERTSRSGQ